MNTYSRALRHISMKDVKQKHQQKLIEQKIKEEKKKEEEKYIASVMEEKKYEWRTEIEKINNGVEKQTAVDNFLNYEYDWREKVLEDKKKYFEEGMTSSETFFTTLPATGDTDLQSISGGDQNSFDPVYNIGIQFGSSGNGSGRMGGFNIGANYLQFSQTPEISNDRSAGTIKVDTSTYTTVTISAIVGNNSNGGVSPTENLSVYWFSSTDGGILGQIPSNGGSLTDYSFTLPVEARGQDIDIFLYEPDVPEQKIQYIGQSIPSLHPSTWDDEVAGYANGILSQLNPTTDDFDYYGGLAWIRMQQQYYGSTGAFTWNYPGYPAPVSGNTDATTQADRIAIGQAIYNAFGSGSSTRYPLTYGILNIGYRRLTPVNVFVSLDSPEATSFIRTDPIMSNLSPEERRKKLKDMLKASDEYVTKMLGLDFPGTGAVPPGEYDPFKQAPPGEAGDTPGVSVSTQPTYLYPGGLVTSGKVRGLTPIRQVSQSQSRSQSRSQKINFTHTYDVVTDSGVEKHKMNLSTTVPTDASGNLIDVSGDESLKNTTTSSQQISQTQKAVLSSPEVANAVEKLGTAGKTYLDYLTNNLPNVIDNNYLGQEYVNSIFKDAKINHMGTVSVGDNIVGTGGKATYDPKTKTVSIPFNYDFKTNDQEFSDPSKAGRVNNFQKAVLNAVGPYSADAQLNTPILPLNSLAGIVLGGAIGVSKALGGGQAKKGNVTMDADKLKKINPSLYNQIVKEEVTSEGKLISEKKLKSPKEVLDRIPGYYDGKPSPLGFPETPPPKMVNGMHPDLVDGKKVADRFNRLDPISANAMPLTGNPHIDKKVKAARKKLK